MPSVAGLHHCVDAQLERWAPYEADDSFTEIRELIVKELTTSYAWKYPSSPAERTWPGRQRTLPHLPQQVSNRVYLNTVQLGREPAQR